MRYRNMLGLVILLLLCACPQPRVTGNFARQIDVTESTGGGPIGPLLTTVGPSERYFYIIGSERVGKFCAEPPPEAASSVASALATALSAGVNVAGTDADVKVGFDNQTTRLFTETISQLFVPSQGLQLYRAGLYGLCQSFANGSIKEEKFWSSYENLVKQSTLLIQAELQRPPRPSQASPDTLATIEKLSEEVTKLQEQLSGNRPQPKLQQPTPQQDARKPLQVTITVTGAGKVDFDGREVCALKCTYEATAMDNVQFTATPTTNNEFDEWTGCEPTNETKCRVSVNSNKEIGVTFKPK